MSGGKVWLVGAGPGAPDLLTVRALRLLQQADIVFHDALVDPQIVAFAGQAERVAVGKRCGRHSTAQRFINKRLIAAAAAYRTIVRLKGGDPMLFGRAQEEIDALVEAGIEVEVVPGITAALAASADALRSLTARGVSRSVTFVTPRVGAGEDRSDWLHAAAAADTAVIYTASHEAAAIGAALIAAGRPAATPVALVEDASLASRQVLPSTLATLGTTARRLRGGPALIVVGDNFGTVAARARADTARSDACDDAAAAATLAAAMAAPPRRRAWGRP
jgi:uroporphyrin-III C-methyltransferase